MTLTVKSRQHGPGSFVGWVTASQPLVSFWLIRDSCNLGLHLLTNQFVSFMRASRRNVCF